MNVTNTIAKDYGKMDTWSSGKNKANSNPIQSQYKPNSKPKQSQNKPKQSQFQRQKNIRIKGIFYLTSIHRTAMYINYRYSDLEIQN